VTPALALDITSFQAPSDGFDAQVVFFARPALLPAASCRDLPAAGKSVALSRVHWRADRGSRVIMAMEAINGSPAQGRRYWGGLFDL